MFCDACGVSVRPDQRFCGSCGKSFSDVPGGAAPRSPYSEGRVARHIQLVGILTMAGSIIGLVWGLSMLRLGHAPFVYSLGHWPHPFRVFSLPHAFGTWVFTCAVAGLIAGWGLMQRLPWARPAALLMNTLAMVYVPFGTLLGLYTLWVLLPREAEQEYRRMTQ